MGVEDRREARTPMSRIRRATIAAVGSNPGAIGYVLADTQLPEGVIALRIVQ